MDNRPAANIHEPSPREVTILTRDELDEILTSLATHRSHLYEDAAVYVEGLSDFAEELLGRGYVTEGQMSMRT